jgi:hypothetical protein
MQSSDSYIIYFDCYSGFEIKPVASENLTYNDLCHFIDGPMPMVYDDIFGLEGFTTLLYHKEEDYSESCISAQKKNDLLFNGYIISCKSQDQFFQTRIHGNALFVRGYDVHEMYGWSYDEATKILDFLSVEVVPCRSDDY